MSELVKLSHGGGGKEMQELLRVIWRILPKNKNWQGSDQDAAYRLWPGGAHRSSTIVKDKKPAPAGQKLVFTTDSYIVDPLFFPGGDIGKLAICGTINDLAVMGAKPLGISLALIIEEGFLFDNLKKILRSVATVSRREKVAVVTGDTKVVEKGGVKGIVINTSGVGTASRLVSNAGLNLGDVIIVSGGIGEHALAILARRFDYQTRLKSDCQPLWRQIAPVKKYLTAGKDATRGGISAALNEMSQKSKVRIVLRENQIPVRREVRAMGGILGFSPYDLACEGRFLAGVPENKVAKVLKILKKLKQKPAVIGRVETGRGVFLETKLGKRVLPMPEGKLVPRIC